MSHISALSDDQLDAALGHALMQKSQKVAMVVLRAVKQFDEADEPRIDAALARLAARVDVGHAGDLTNWRASEIWLL